MSHPVVGRLYSLDANVIKDKPKTEVISWDTWMTEWVKGVPRRPLYVYVFVGAGFPMHCDLIWYIVRPL
jgi:hypothetical protein